MIPCVEQAQPRCNEILGTGATLTPPTSPHWATTWLVHSAGMTPDDVYDLIHDIEKGMLPSQLAEQRDIFNLGVPLFKVQTPVKAGAVRSVCARVCACVRAFAHHLLRFVTFQGRFQGHAELFLRGRLAVRLSPVRDMWRVRRSDAKRAAERVVSGCARFSPWFLRAHHRPHCNTDLPIPPLPARGLGNPRRRRILSANA